MGKMAKRLWKSLSNIIRSLMEEGKIVDTLYFGTFAKASHLSEANADKSYFIYCPGPKSLLKLIENEENFCDLP